jgi:DNA invertase Pin-like site-specific DNA recombinase
MSVCQAVGRAAPQLYALMSAARNREIDCVLVWKFDRFARSTRHLLVALEEFNHLGVRFISVQDQVDTDSPMGRAMFTIIAAMAELESSLISERVTAGMKAAETRGKHLGRPAISQRTVREIEALATSTDLSIRQLQSKIAGRASRGIKLPSAPVPHSSRPCDHFLNVSRTYPLMIESAAGARSFADRGGVQAAFCTGNTA